MSKKKRSGNKVVEQLNLITAIINLITAVLLLIIAFRGG